MSVFIIERDTMENRKLKLLVISDDAKSAAYFKKTISEALPGTKVMIAINGIKGIKLAKIQEPDVILIDISTSDADVIRISQMIKKQKIFQLVPMLFITNLENDRIIRENALKVGAEAFLVKPIDDAILITQITEMAKTKERNIIINLHQEQLEFIIEQRTRELKNEIVDRKKLEKELRNSEKTLKTYIEKAPIGVFVTDSTGKYIDANAMACQLMGRTKNEVLMLSISDFLVPDDLDRGLKAFHKLLNTGFMNAELRVHKKNNHVFWISLRGAKINENRFIAFCIDISQRKEKEARVEYLSYHDSLTGIFNRAYYEEAVLNLDTNDNLPFSMIISDVNGLKLINDTFGHASGDKILIETTKLLSMNLREGDILARVGGDEFSILLPKTNNQEVQDIVNRIQEACQEKNIYISKEPMQLSVSLGHATKTKQTESFSYISKLAEDYMYRQKLLERESFHSTLLETLRVSLFERSNETEEHASRMIQLSKKLGIAMGLDNNDLNDLSLLSSLHDIGKISIDNSILLKPGKLTDIEWLEIKKHPGIGYRIAMASIELRSIAKYILCHHEHWDGTGYPQGLIGKNIPLLSRIIAVVDAYDAMTNDRPYRKAMSKEDAITEISINSGSQFDPEIVKFFLTII